MKHDHPDFDPEKHAAAIVERNTRRAPSTGGDVSRQTKPIGDVFLDMALFVWVTAAVGPWWIGVVLFVCAFLLNIVGARRDV